MNGIETITVHVAECSICGKTVNNLNSEEFEEYRLKYEFLWRLKDLGWTYTRKGSLRCPDCCCRVPFEELEE